MNIQSQLARIEAYSLLAAKNVLTLEDVVLLTGFSKGYLYKLTSKQQIPFYKPGGKQMYFDRAEVENWLKQNKVSTIEEIDHKATTFVTTRAKKGGEL
ncbi:MAG TPA: hypothetical protein DCF91_12780 [Porphyromonadaceae bacterium]|nr:hypothetical protein [Porphyromonadaceae bacterium]